MHASQFGLVLEGTGQLSYTCKRLLDLRKYAFLAGRWADCLGDLCNFWAEQLTAAQDSAIPRLSSPAGKNCAIFSVKLD